MPYSWYSLLYVANAVIIIFAQLPLLILCTSYLTRDVLVSVVGYTVQDSILKKMAQLAQKLGSLQQTNNHGFVHEKVEAAEENDGSEFGAGY
jgi:hypothetical protein